MTFEIAMAIFGVATIASIMLMLRAVSGHAWHLMWGASVASLLVSSVTILSIGAFILLLTCFQLAATLAMRRSASGREWLILLGIAAFVWFLLVPIQILGAPWLGIFGNLALIGGLGLALPLLPFAVARPRST